MSPFLAQALNGATTHFTAAPRPAIPLDVWGLVFMLAIVLLVFLGWRLLSRLERREEDEHREDIEHEASETLEKWRREGQE